ncbi:MAG TPA: hypothetical protein VM324_14620 [Egibacteraceae bacterium]|jgi:hypothetical protein|nr:hypothetical protein [Egibacteraceae bacterium]
MSETAERSASQPSRRPTGKRLAELLTITDETDEHGRLLLEDSAPDRAIRRATRAGVPMRTVACPYRDSPSRKGGRMNVSAYEDLRRDTAEVLSGLAWLAEHYFRREPAARGTVRGATDLSKLGVTLPLVLFHRARDPFRRHGELPSFVAAIFKACRGMFSATFDMLGKRGGGAVTAQELVAYAESEGHLRRVQTGTVCAAPTRLIERTVAVLLTGQGADPATSRLGDVVAFEALWNFFQVEKAFNANLGQYGHVLEQLVRAGRRVDDPALFDATIRVRGEVGRFGDFTDAFLRYANQAQALMNRALERAENAPPMTFQDVLAAL